MIERWKRVGEVFHQALEKPAAERDQFVSEACRDDPELEAEVRTLLQHDARASGFLEGYPALALPDSPPEQVGVWKVVRPLGAGGMGTVYLAERGDGQYRQTGAVKLIRTGLVSDAMVRRFRRERQILAGLSHPGIAKLLDGGTTAEGAPWLVMEYIEGQLLHVWCRERKLPLRERLDLFVQVCDAVSYAHQRMVLHRDIKPDNIIVTSDGTPRILDFGIARVLDEGLESEPGSALTLEPLTPDYASPEQIRGEAPTAATDLYALGVILYELISGMGPYPEAQTPHQVVQAVLTVQPPKPSAAVGDGARMRPSRLGTPSDPPRTLQRKLAGDLDVITLKALQKDPARRYTSVEQLADDVRRFLEARPVMAQPDRWSYRASRFVRRNRVAVGFGSLALLGLVVGLVIALWQGSVARREHEVAERRFNEVRSLARTLLFDVHDAVARLPGATPARELILARGVEYLDRLTRDAAGDTTLMRELAEGYERVGDVQGLTNRQNTGKTDEAYANLSKARVLREELLRMKPGDTGRIEALSGIYNQLATIDFTHGRPDRAVVWLRQDLVWEEQLSTSSPSNLEHRHDLTIAQYNLGRVLITNGAVDSGLTLIDRAARNAASLVESDPGSARFQLEHRAIRLNRTHFLLRKPGYEDSVVSEVRRLVTWLERADAPVFKPAEPALEAARNQETIASLYALLSRVQLLRQAMPDSAAGNAEQATRLLRSATSVDPGDESTRKLLDAAVALQGYAAGAAGRAARARELLEPLTPRLEASLSTNASGLETRRALIEAAHGLGLAHLAVARSAPRGSETRSRSLTLSQQWLVRAHDEIIRLRSNGDRFELTGDEQQAIDRDLAACAAAVKESRL